jgi:hypothetical protein
MNWSRICMDKQCNLRHAIVEFLRNTKRASKIYHSIIIEFSISYWNKCFNTFLAIVRIRLNHGHFYDYYQRNKHAVNENDRLFDMDDVRAEVRFVECCFFMFLLPINNESILYDETNETTRQYSTVVEIHVYSMIFIESEKNDNIMNISYELCK